MSKHLWQLGSFQTGRRHWNIKCNKHLARINCNIVKPEACLTMLLFSHKRHKHFVSPMKVSPMKPNQNKMLLSLGYLNHPDALSIISLSFWHQHWLNYKCMHISLNESETTKFRPPGNTFDLKIWISMFIQLTQVS